MHTLKDKLLAVELFLLDEMDIAVDYDEFGTDEYWIDDKLITINNSQNKRKQLYVLLHESGHAILRKRKEFPLMCSYANSSHKIETLKEEVFAWEEARRLAKHLNIDIDQDMWTAHTQVALTKYVHWVCEK